MGDPLHLSGYLRNPSLGFARTARFMVLDAAGTLRPSTAPVAEAAAAEASPSGPGEVREESPTSAYRKRSCRFHAFSLALSA